MCHWQLSSVQPTCTQPWLARVSIIVITIISVQMTETAGMYQDSCPQATVVVISKLYTCLPMLRYTTQHS